MNSQNTNELVEVENKYWKDLNMALQRLKENSDFQKLILEGYFKEKAVDGVSMLANPGVIREGKRGEILESLVAISHLEDFFLVIENIGAVPDSTEEEEESDNLNAYTPASL